MVTVNVRGHEFNVNDDVVDTYKFACLIDDLETGEEKRRFKTSRAIFDMLVDGGMDKVAEELDPISQNPKLNDMTQVISDIFDSLGDTIKNSFGSQHLSKSASQNLERTYNDSTESISTIIERNE